MAVKFCSWLWFSLFAFVRSWIWRRKRGSHDKCQKQSSLCFYRLQQYSLHYPHCYITCWDKYLEIKEWLQIFTRKTKDIKQSQNLIDEWSRETRCECSYKDKRLSMWFGKTSKSFRGPYPSPLSFLNKSHAIPLNLVSLILFLFRSKYTTWNDLDKLLGV